MVRGIFVGAGLFAASVVGAEPASIEGLAVLGSPGTYVFDTAGSVAVTGGDTFASPDTEMAIWDASGLLLAANDDGPGGLGSPSEIEIFLDVGRYFVGISEFDSVFGDNFTNTGSNFEDGDIYDVVLNIDGMQFGNATIGFDSSIGFESRTVFFRVDVVPAPASAAMLGLGGLVGRRRR